MDPAFESVARRLVHDGQPRAEVEKLFVRTEMRFDPAVMSDKMLPLIRAKVAPQPARPTPENRYAPYLAPALIERGRGFLQGYRQLFETVERRTGVPPSVVVAILVVETKLGTTLGRASTLEVLANMAACEDFRLIQNHLPMNQIEPETRRWVVERTRQKAQWAYDELWAFLEYCRRNGLDPVSVKGSPFGAMGWPQFMPSNALRYAVDGDGDGQADLFDGADALASVAHFLRQNGWRPELPEERHKKAIMAYNPSEEYAQAVLDVAARIAEADEAWQAAHSTPPPEANATTTLPPP